MTIHLADRSNSMMRRWEAIFGKSGKSQRQRAAHPDFGRMPGWRRDSSAA
jgi:hypothetical protein